MERTEACSSRKSLHVLRIPLEEAKTDGLDRTLSARSAHAERTLNSKCHQQSTAERHRSEGREEVRARLRDSLHT